jgi:hypothetical protein
MMMAVVLRMVRSTVELKATKVGSTRKPSMKDSGLVLRDYLLRPHLLHDLAY